MDRQLISSGAAFEQRVGYSRAVRVGEHVWVSGTAPIMPGDADPPGDPYDQARVCIEIIGRALAVDDQVPEVGEGLALGETDLCPGRCRQRLGSDHQ